MPDTPLPNFLPPTNDLVFKLLLERNRGLLDTMLSAVLDRNVHVEEILNPGLPGDGLKDKLMQLDLRVRFADGARAFVEMQTTNHAYLRERFLGYLCREFSSQPKQGMPYTLITPTIGIVWQTGAPHPEYGFHDVFRFRGDRSGKIYTDLLSLHMLQLGLAPTTRPPAESPSERYVRLFAQFLAVKSRHELDALEKEEPSMTDAANALKTITADPEVARRALERAEAEYYYELALRKERELGEAEGRAEGKAETVLKLITLKFGAPSEAVQNRVRSAPIEYLDRLAEKILFASSVDSLLDPD